MLPAIFDINVLTHCNSTLFSTSSSSSEWDLSPSYVILRRCIVEKLIAPYHVRWDSQDTFSTSQQRTQSAEIN
jgi:hypothetical protein